MSSTFNCQLYGPSGNITITIIATSYGAAQAYIKDHAASLGEAWTEGSVQEVYV